MKYLILLVLLLVGCLTSDTPTGYGSYNTLYIDGCYYIITSRGGITPKVNQPLQCTDRGYYNQLNNNNKDY